MREKEKERRRERMWEGGKWDSQEKRKTDMLIRAWAKSDVSGIGEAMSVSEGCGENAGMGGDGRMDGRKGRLKLEGMEWCK